MLFGRSQTLWSLSRNCEQRNAGGWWIKRLPTASTARASSPGGSADITAGGIKRILIIHRLLSAYISLICILMLPSLDFAVASSATTAATTLWWPSTVGKKSAVVGTVTANTVQWWRGSLKQSWVLQTPSLLSLLHLERDPNLLRSHPLINQHPEWQVRATLSKTQHKNSTTGGWLDFWIFSSLLFIMYFISVSDPTNKSDDGAFDIITEEDVHRVYDSDAASQTTGGSLEGEQDSQAPRLLNMWV